MKAHLYTTEDPFNRDADTIADCGVLVPRAQILFMWDEAAMGEGLSYGKNVCGKCQLADEGPRGKMLVYGIAEGKREQSTDTTAGEE